MDKSLIGAASRKFVRNNGTHVTNRIRWVTLLGPSLSLGLTEPACEIVAKCPTCESGVWLSLRLTRALFVPTHWEAYWTSERCLENPGVWGRAASSEAGLFTHRFCGRARIRTLLLVRLKSDDFSYGFLGNANHRAYSIERFIHRALPSRADASCGTGSSDAVPAYALLRSCCL